jgi:hypothetical protein
LSFRIVGCDEIVVDYQMKELWTVASSEPIDPDLSEKERLLFRLAAGFFGSGFGWIFSFARENEKSIAEGFAKWALEVLRGRAFALTVMVGRRALRCRAFSAG